MAKPPQTPPSSDIDGVHQDGTGGSRPLPTHGQDAGDLEEAAKENVARPDYKGVRTDDDRTA